MRLAKPRRLRWFAVSVILLGLLAFYRFSVHGRFVALGASWEQEHQAEKAIRELREENARLEQVIEGLDPNGREIDRIIREDLRWVGPEERMIDLPGKQ